MSNGKTKPAKTGRSETKLGRSELRYRRLFEAAKDGILMLDPVTRKITEANPFIATFLGYTREQLLKKELWQIGLLKDEAASQAAFRALKKNGFIRYEDLPLESKSGVRLEVEFVSNLYREGGDEVIQCNIRDITARKRIEEALSISEARFRALFELEPIGIYSCDHSGTIQEFNRSAAHLWGRRPKAGDRSERFCGSFKMFLPDGRPLPHRLCPMAAVLQGRVRSVRDAEVVLERPDGSRINVMVNIVPLHSAQKRLIGAINCFYDITKGKQAEAALRLAQVKLAEHAGSLTKIVLERTAQLTAKNRRLVAFADSTRQGKEKYQLLFLESQVMQRKLRHLTHQIISAQEEERKEISRELHDEVVQMLVGINVELAALGQGAAVGLQDLREKITLTQRLVENSVNAVHRYARELRPAVLDDLGLIPALHAYCRNLAERKKFKIQLTAFAGVEDLADAKRTVLFRVAQEALTNVARHARATHVKMTITPITGAVRMEISDNGQSFQVDKVLGALNPKRLGLVGMRERIEMVGGNLAIESKPGHGTTVRAEIPLAPGTKRP